MTSPNPLQVIREALHRLSHSPPKSSRCENNCDRQQSEDGGLAALEQIETERDDLIFAVDSYAASGPSSDEVREMLTEERTARIAAEQRIEELNRLKARTWTEYEMEDAQWTFTFHIHRDDDEDVLAHELAHAVQRFRWPDDEVHSARHLMLAKALTAALASNRAVPDQQPS
jgi:hypothetical protein